MSRKVGLEVTEVVTMTTSSLDTPTRDNPQMAPALVGVVPRVTGRGTAPFTLLTKTWP